MSNYANILDDLFKSPAPTSPPRGGKYTKREWTGERWRYYYADSTSTEGGGPPSEGNSEEPSSDWSQEKQLKWVGEGKTGAERSERRKKIFALADAAKKTASEQKKQKLENALSARDQRIQFEKQRNNEAA